MLIASIQKRYSICAITHCMGGGGIHQFIGTKPILPLQQTLVMGFVCLDWNINEAFENALQSGSF